MFETFTPWRSFWITLSRIMITVFAMMVTFGLVVLGLTFLAGLI